MLEKFVVIHLAVNNKIQILITNVVHSKQFFHNFSFFSRRKLGMLVNSLLGLAAAALLGFSEIPGSYEMVITGRLVVGINCGEYWPFHGCVWSNELVLDS